MDALILTWSQALNTHGNRIIWEEHNVAAEPTQTRRRETWRKTKLTWRTNTRVPHDSESEREQHDWAEM